MIGLNHFFSIVNYVIFTFNGSCHMLSIFIIKCCNKKYSKYSIQRYVVTNDIIIDAVKLYTL